MSRLSVRILLAFFLCAQSHQLQAESLQGASQTTISGTVVSAEDNEPMPGVNVVVQDKIIGTSTDGDGNFELTVNQDPPFVLVISMIGYQTQQIEITSGNVTELNIALEEQVLLGSEVVVSASRMEESVLEAPVTIEQMDVINIRSTPSDDYYKAISNLKGVDMTSNSINFQVVNSRGFNSTGNTRMVQLIDGMDTQAPALNFPIGNLNGPSELDVERIEYIPGAASALYGPNAFNGILLINSKDPFQYQGLSLMVKSGVNHVNGNEAVGEPGTPQSTWNTAFRYARAFNNRFAFKMNFAYSQAEDWRGTNFSDKNESLQGNLSVNPARDEIHSYGDDGSFNIRLLAIDPAVRSQLAAALSAQTGVPVSETEQYVGAIPSQPVNRTGYAEHYLVDYGAENLKANASVHYRISDLLEASYSFNYGYGTSIYTGAQRYSLKNFNVSQHKVELNGSNFNVKAYGTFENSGDSYIADFAGFAVNEAYSANEVWFPTYGTAFAGALLQAATTAQSGNPTFNAATVNSILSDPSLVSQFHIASRNVADAGRYAPGSAQFDAAVDGALQNPIPNGALFDDNSRFYHAEGQYNFRNEIDFAEAIVGASFRQYQLRSNGTIFDDEGGVNINEWGGYLQLSRGLFEEMLTLTGSIRYDKNENFDGQFSPRISGVLNVAENQNIRASFQTGFRNPTTQGQYIDLNVITARLLGGLPQFAEKYSITQSTYTIESVLDFQNEVLAGNPAAANELVPYDSYEPVKPEQVKAFEIGYKGFVGDRLFFDAAYYYNIYDDFITQTRIRQINSDLNSNGTIESGEILAPSAGTLPLLLSGDQLNTFQIYTNVDQTVKAHGAVVGLEFSLADDYNLGVNYNWNRLISELETFQNDFNTPEHKVNVTFGNRRLTDRLGFNVVYRWQDAFRWESSFAFEDVEAVSTVDAQVNYRFPEYSATLKLGGTNVFNNQHSLSGGGPNLGAIYYVSLTFDQLFR